METLVCDVDHLAVSFGFGERSGVLANERGLPAHFFGLSHGSASQLTELGEQLEEAHRKGGTTSAITADLVKPECSSASCDVAKV